MIAGADKLIAEVDAMLDDTQSRDLMAGILDMSRRYTSAQMLSAVVALVGERRRARKP